MIHFAWFRVNAPVRPLRFTAIKFTAMGILLGTLAVVPAGAAALYSLTFKANRPDWFQNTSTTPVQQTYSWTLGTTSFESVGYANPGRFGMIERLTTASPGGTDSEQANASEAADDFIITGPAGPTTVTGTMYFQATANATVSGGLAGTNSTQGGGWIYFMWADYYSPVQTIADYYVGNQNAAGTGFMSAFVAPGGVFPASITANFPVGTPFTILMALSSAGATYAQLQNSPAVVEANLSGAIGDASGHVIDLPPGYTLSSVEWGIANSTIQTTAVEQTTWGKVKSLYRTSP